MDSVAKNYARNSEPIPTRQFELVGDLIMDSCIIGSSDFDKISDSLTGVVVRTNINLTRGSITLRFTYHGINDHFFLGEITLAELGGKSQLGMVVKTFMSEGNRVSEEIEVNSKKVIDPETGNTEWNIAIRPRATYNSINVYNMYYVATSSEIVKPSQPGANSYVVCKAGLTAQDGTDFDEDTWNTVRDPMLTLLPVGTIIAWYPPTQADREDPTNSSMLSGDSCWRLCDGASIYEGSDQVKHRVPDLRGRFIMGYGKKVNIHTNLSTKTDTDKDTTYDVSKKARFDTVHPATTDSEGNIIEPEYTLDVSALNPDNDLTIYNSDGSRSSTSGSTEGVQMKTFPVNCSIVGATGGSYLIKLLPKQQGSLVMGWRYGKGDNAKTNYAPFSGFKLAWNPTLSKASPFTRGTQDILWRFQNGWGRNDMYDNQEPENIFGTNNVQGGINAEKVGGSEWKYGRAYLSEGASLHDNKPPYMVMVYIIKVK